MTNRLLAAAFMLLQLTSAHANDITAIAPTGPVIDSLTKQGNLVAGSWVDLAKSGVGVAVRRLQCK